MTEVWHHLFARTEARLKCKFKKRNRGAVHKRGMRQNEARTHKRDGKHARTR